jgi:hypothetical protein
MADTTVSNNNKAIAFRGKPQREKTNVGKLDAKSRAALPAQDFAGPNGSYPDEDPGHAKAALARVSEFGSPKVKAEVKKNVASKYPNMKVKKLKKAGAISDKQACKYGM